MIFDRHAHNYSCINDFISIITTALFCLCHIALVMSISLQNQILEINFGNLFSGAQQNPFNEFDFGICRKKNKPTSDNLGRIRFSRAKYPAFKFPKTSQNRMR